MNIKREISTTFEVHAHAHTRRQVSHLERNLGKAFLVLTDKHEQYLKTAAVEDNKARHQDAKALDYMKGVVDCLAQASINLSTIINAADPSVKVRNGF